MMAVLQQLLASSHAIAARLICVENNQAQPQQQQQQQQFGAPAGGLMAPWAGGGMGGQPLPEPQDANRQAAELE